MPVEVAEIPAAWAPASPLISLTTWFNVVPVVVTVVGVPSIVNTMLPVPLGVEPAVPEANAQLAIQALEPTSTHVPEAFLYHKRFTFETATIA